ncbi:Zinc transporter ZIP6 [Takifugu flavidus]|uniref:Zinc transporter ZIP6 n=1 Tax=Takifugu flavidus TaxID=433684 RepID=A0A5C6NZY9_9TELE|nr:Zinc transporter ZIP6 [Takifugu flavidus]
MEQKRRRAVVAAVIFLAVSLAQHATSASSNCSAATSPPDRLSSVVDPSAAQQSQRRHLEALFNRYGENGTISLDGLRRLLRTVGLDHIRNATIQRHKQPDQQHQHDPPHDHHHDHGEGHHDDHGEGHHDDHDLGDAERVTLNLSSGAAECLNASTILSSHGMSQEVGVSLDDFSLLCPALLHQIDEGACIVHARAAGGDQTDHKHRHSHHGNKSHHDHGDHSGDGGKSITIAWLGGFISITVISLLSLLGIVLIPLMGKVFFKFLLSFLVALAVGTLSGDALLHLIPHSQGGHHHPTEDAVLGSWGDHHSHAEHSEDLDAVWKGLTALAGVYLMFLIEHFLTLGKIYKDKKQKIQRKWDQKDKLDPEKQPALEENDMKPSDVVTQWCPSGDPVVVTQWWPSGGPVVSQWCPSGDPVVAQWWPSGGPVVTQCGVPSQWCPSGVPSQWWPSGGPVVSQWLCPSDVETNGASIFADHTSGLQSGVAEEEQVMLAPQAAAVSPGVEAYSAEDCENKCHSHFHDTVGQTDSLHHHHHDYHHILHHHHSQNHHPHSHAHSYSEQHFQQAGIATLAWMVIMGDGLHNFSDGLAIGAAFTEGLSSGLSTSVAVFCHELPHELGDFAVLLKAGMTVRQAILYNALSAMMAYLGLVTGILIGHYAENISMWIFALTAGLFMYVALVDMMPEMLHNDAGDQGFSHCGFFLLQNTGILLGFAIMLLIAIFEHHIQLDLGY